MEWTYSPRRDTDFTHWFIVRAKVSCPFCGAPAGTVCKTKAGRNCTNHKARGQAARKDEELWRAS